MLPSFKGTCSEQFSSKAIYLSTFLDGCSFRCVRNNRITWWFWSNRCNRWNGSKRCIWVGRGHWIDWTVWCIRKYRGLWRAGSHRAGRLLWCYRYGIGKQLLQRASPCTERTRPSSGKIHSVQNSLATALNSHEQLSCLQSSRNLHFLKRYYKAMRRVPAYSKLLRRIRGVVRTPEMSREDPVAK